MENSIFMKNEFFLLKTESAKALYQAVKDLPIIDYHNHLSIEDIAKNRRFHDIYDLWIKPDPYKHRAMRMCGVAERYITGDASNQEKFVKWCETLPKLQLNPLSYWSMMELETLFEITEMPNGENAQEIYRRCNVCLQEKNFTANSILQTFRVEYACPCAALTDDISPFAGNPCVAPSLRGDSAVMPTLEFIEQLGERTQIRITDLEKYEIALEKALLAFKNANCIFSDHALDDGFVYVKDDKDNPVRFQALLTGEITPSEREKLSSYLLCALGKLYAKHGFVMQLHIGAQRYTSTKLRQAAGASGGFAGIGNSVHVRSLTTLLDEIDCAPYGLPKTLLFPLNPADNAAISVLAGSYAKDGVDGLVTQGPAWWWCDHKQGIVETLENAAAFSALSNFIGMTTDSRSFLSFVRHDYFRRILCGWLAEKWAQGEFLGDWETLEKLAQKLCYRNAKKTVGK